MSIPLCKVVGEYDVVRSVGLMLINLMAYSWLCKLMRLDSSRWSAYHIVSRYVCLRFTHAHGRHVSAATPLCAWHASPAAPLPALLYPDSITYGLANAPKPLCMHVAPPAHRKTPRHTASLTCPQPFPEATPQSAPDTKHTARSRAATLGRVRRARRFARHSVHGHVWPHGLEDRLVRSRRRPAHASRALSQCLTPHSPKPQNFLQHNRCNCLMS